MGLPSQVRQAKGLLIACILLVVLSCNKQPLPIDVQGHRGCRGLMPENTIPAFLKAVDLGVTTLELDVVISGDGNVVVSHEAILNPEICTSPTGTAIGKNEVFNLYTMPYQEIAKCDCGSLGNPRFRAQQKMPVHKPLLRDVLISVKQHCAAVGKALPMFNVEIKSNPRYVFLYHPSIQVYADKVLAVLRAELSPAQFTIQSFDVFTLQYVHAVYPEVALAFLLEDGGMRTAAQIDADVERLGFLPAIYSCHYTMLTADNVAYLQRKGVRVIPWTVNEGPDMQAMLRFGVDGMITDYPDRLMAILGKKVVKD